MSFGEDIAALVRASKDPLLATAPSWQRVRLDEVARITNGFPWKSEHFGRADGVPLARIRDVTLGWTGTRYSGAVVDGYWIDKGDLLVGMDGDFNVCRWNSERALLNQRVCKVQTDERVYSNRLLEYILPPYLRAINDATSSVTVKHLSSKTLSEIPLPVPPPCEQRRIVAKLDALTARIVRARAELDRVPALAKRILDAATFALWDTRETIGLARLLREPIRNGLSLKGSDAPPGVPSLKLSALKRSPVDLDDIRYLPVSDDRAAPYVLADGDVLVSRGNGTRSLVGRASLAEVDEGRRPTIFPDTAFRLRLDRRRYSSKWLTLVWNSPRMREQIERVARTTAGIWKISQRDLLGFDLPDIDRLRQDEIADRLGRAFARADRLEAEAARARVLLDRLEAAILAKAFRGELVPQDPNDEPASLLLDRIRAERAAAPKPKRGRRAASKS